MFNKPIGMVGLCGFADYLTQFKILNRFDKNRHFTASEKSIKDKLNTFHSYDIIMSKDIENENFIDLILISHLKNTYYGIGSYKNQIYYSGCALLGYFSFGLSIFLLMPILCEKLYFLTKINKALNDKRFGLYGMLRRDEEDV